jgi:hypothetical protein
MTCGPKTKLSIFTAFAAEGWSFAATLRAPAKISDIAIITGIAKPAIHIFFRDILFFPFEI